MSFPADIRGCMKDCILSLFWPRKDIVGFVEQHGCTKGEIASLQLEGDNALKRHEVVDALFAALAARRYSFDGTTSGTGSRIPAVSPQSSLDAARFRSSSGRCPHFLLI